MSRIYLGMGNLACILAVSLLALSASVAHADPLFTYSSNVTPTTMPDPPATGSEIEIDTDPPFISLASQSGSGNATSPGAKVPVMTITLDTSDYDLDSYSTLVQFPFTITASGGSQTIMYQGTVSGMLGGEGNSTLTLNSITPFDPQVFDLGAYQYTVSLVPPNLSDNSDSFSLKQGDNTIYATVVATLLPSGSSAVPEPGTFLLWGVLGLAGLACRGRKRPVTGV